jgi:hypothetical protein
MRKKIDDPKRAERLVRAIVSDIWLYNTKALEGASNLSEARLAVAEEIETGRAMFSGRVDSSIEELGIYDKVINQELGKKLGLESDADEIPMELEIEAKAQGSAALPPPPAGLEFDDSERPPAHTAQSFAVKRETRPSVKEVQAAQKEEDDMESTSSHLEIDSLPPLPTPKPKAPTPPPPPPATPPAPQKQEAAPAPRPAQPQELPPSFQRIRRRPSAEVVAAVTEGIGDEEPLALDLQAPLELDMPRERSEPRIPIMPKAPSSARAKSGSKGATNAGLVFLAILLVLGLVGAAVYYLYFI